MNWNSLFHGNRRRQELLIVGTLSLIALVTRVYGIWEWPITGDEYFTIEYADERATGIFGSAYYALVLISQEVFGATKWAARLPSVMSGVLGIPAFYLMCRRIFNWRVAAVGCVFIILSEWHLFHSQIARFYSGVFLFGALSYYFYYSCLYDGSYVHLFLFFLSSMVAASFHPTSVLIVFSCGLYSVFLVVYRRTGVSEKARFFAGVHLSVCVIAAIVASPRLFEIINSWGVNYRGIGIETIISILGIVENMGVVLSVGAVLGLCYLLFRDIQKFYLFLLLTTVPVLSVFLFSVILPPSRPRYMFYSLPIFFALSSLICVKLSTDIEGSFLLKNSATLIVSAVLFVSFVSHYSGRISLSIKDPVNFIQSNYRGEDNVVVFGPYAEYNFGEGVDVHTVLSKALWEEGVIPVAKKKGRTWIIVDTYRTVPLRQDLEAWLMENASLKWRKEETRFDYTQRGYEVWLETAD